MSYTFAMQRLAAVLLPVLACALPAAAGEVASSTAAVSESSAAARGRTAAGPVFGAPISLSFGYDHRKGATVNLGYSLRWDFSDVRRLPGAAARLAANPFDTAGRTAVEIVRGADFGVYSLRFKSADLFALRDEQAAGAPGPGPAPVVEFAPGRRDRRVRLRLDPVAAEVRRGLRRELRRQLIRSSFELAMPAGLDVPFGQKEAVFDSLERAGRASFGEEVLDRKE